MSELADSFGFPVVDLPPSAISSPDAVVRFLVSHLVQSRRLRAEHADRVCCAVLHRESLGSTGMGRGVAIPHSKSEATNEVLGIVGRSAEPMCWPGALDSGPVQVVCLLITPVNDPSASMRALETVSRRLRGEHPSGE